MGDLGARDPSLTVRPRARISQAAIAVVVSALSFAGASRLFGQNPASPQLQLTLISRDLRRTVPLALAGNQELVGLDDLATAFQLTVREESGAITVTYR